MRRQGGRKFLILPGHELHPRGGLPLDAAVTFERFPMGVVPAFDHAGNPIRKGGTRLAVLVLHVEVLAARARYTLHLFNPRYLWVPVGEVGKKVGTERGNWGK